MSTQCAASSVGNLPLVFCTRRLDMLLRAFAISQSDGDEEPVSSLPEKPITVAESYEITPAKPAGQLGIWWGAGNSSNQISARQ